MELLQPFGAIVIVLGTLGVTLGLLRRRGIASFSFGAGGTGAARLIEVLETRPLGPGHTVFAVRSGGRRLLVATYAGGCTLLESIPAGPEART